MQQDEKKARLSELDLAHLESSQWARYSSGRNEYAPTEPARAAAEIRALRARITELESLLAEAREVVGMFRMVRIDGEEHACVQNDAKNYVIFSEGEFFGADNFYAATRRAAALSTKLEAQQ